jgi:hypothetical protein
MSLKRLVPLAACALAVAVVAARPDDKPIDDEGFIRTWLIAAPVPLGDTEPAAALDKEFVKGEADMAPTDGDKVKAGDKELTVKKLVAKEYFFDFHEAITDRQENCVGYAVCYVVAEKETACTLKIGSDDQCKVFLNGKEVIKNPDARPTEKDQNEAAVALKAGSNVLLFKVVQEGGEWSGCARFVDKDDKPVKGLTVRLTK